MKLLVTGGAGFIGSHIVARLLEDGAAVRVLDNFATGHKENLSGFLDRIDLLEGDIRDLSVVRSAVKGVDGLFHEAAIASVPRSVDDPLENHAVNSGGTLNVLIAARDAGVRRVVYAASSAAYGDSPVLPKTEDMAPGPLSPYAATKLAGEHLCKVFAGVYGVETVSLRYFNVFGPRQDPKSQYAAAIPAFIVPMLEERSPVVYGDGEQTRDFTFVDNVVEANLLAFQSDAPPGEVFNIASGQGYSLNRVLESLESIIGHPARAKYEPGRPGEVRHSVAGIDKAKCLLGYSPKVTLRDGLARTVASFSAALGIKV